MKRMLINATQVEETRIAIVDGQRLEDLDIDNSSKDQKKSNVYKGKVTRIEPSLEAVFVDYGAERHGFLPFKEIAREFLTEAAFAEGGRPNIKAGLKEGQEIVVQIEKEERGNKGAALTTYASLAGRFLVLMPNNPRAGGVSRRIEGDDRAALRDAMNQLDVPQGMGIIVRTAGIGRSAEELQWDLDYQIQIWEAIQAASNDKKAPFLIYQESNVIMRALRDYFSPDIGEILIDRADLFEETRLFADMTMPTYSKRIRQYTEDTPLFNRFQIEQQIESAFRREVSLPAGGSIVIDNTEALVSIDINSARATRGDNIEDTAYQTNMEAAKEIGRQLRLRDIGGLIVIDFIDMMQAKHQKDVEQALRDAVRQDRARIQTGKISKFGLLEMSRQRVRPSLGESWLVVCPQCKGQGMIRGIESLALSILRVVEDEAMKENTSRVLAHVPIEVGTFLLNEKRLGVERIERRTGVSVLLVPSPALMTPEYEIERIRYSDTEHAVYNKASYQLSRPKVHPDAVESSIEADIVQPAVRTVVPLSPAPENMPHVPAPAATATPAAAPASGGGFLAKIFGLFSSNEEPQKPAEKPKRPQQSRNRNRNAKSSDGERSNNRNDRNKPRRNNDRNDTNANHERNRNKRPESDNKKVEKPIAAAPKAREERAPVEEGQEPRRTRGRRGGRRRNGRDQSENVENKTPKAVSPETETAAAKPGTAEYDAVAKTPLTPSSAEPVKTETLRSEDSASQKKPATEEAKAKPEASKTQTANAAEAGASTETVKRPRRQRKPASERNKTEKVVDGNVKPAEVVVDERPDDVNGNIIVAEAKPKPAAKPRTRKPRAKPAEAKVAIDVDANATATIAKADVEVKVEKKPVRRSRKPAAAKPAADTANIASTDKAESPAPSKEVTADTVVTAKPARRPRLKQVETKKPSDSDGQSPTQDA